jgi:hypothetical protein
LGVSFCRWPLNPKSYCENLTGGFRGLDKPVSSELYFPVVGSFTRKRSEWILLLGLLVGITVILVMPEVDLLDVAFQRNTSPVVLHARGTSASLMLSSPSLSLYSTAGGIRHREQVKASAPAMAESLLILNHSLRC